MVFDVIGDVCSSQSGPHGFVEETLTLAVKSVADLFEHDVSVGIHSGMLTVGCNAVEDFVDVRHVEIGADAEVLGPPVVSAQKRMDIRKATLPGCGIPEVAHINLTSKRKVAAGIGSVGQLPLRDVLETSVHVGENLLNGARAQCPLAEHVFLAGCGLHLDAGKSRSLLAAVVLLLHHEVELVQAIQPRSIFLLVVFKRFQQPYHGYTALVF